MYYGTGEGSGDPVDGLNAGNDELAQRVDVVTTGPDDHVIGTGDIVRAIYSGNIANFLCNDGCLSDLRLDQDIRLDQIEPPIALWVSDTSGGCPERARARE